MTRPRTRFHSILLATPSDAFVENHRAYCTLHGYEHQVHAIASASNAPRALLTYKYNLARRLAGLADDGDLLIFADESAAIYSPIEAGAVIGAEESWIVGCAFTGRPDPSIFMLRAGAASRGLLDQILENLRCLPEFFALDRWTHRELEGIPSVDFNKAIDNAHYQSLLFNAFGEQLPELSTFALSFNPIVHGSVPDARLIECFVAYLNSVNARRGRLYDDFPETIDVGSPFEVVNPGRDLAIITGYTPSISVYAVISERNIRNYCNKHGYTFYVYRDVPAELAAKGTMNWAKAEIVLAHLDDHSHAAWIDSDILIHDQDRPLEAIIAGNEITLARDIGGHEFNSGFMVFARSATSGRFLERVKDLIDTAADRTDVYASGGDQHYFNLAWNEAGGAASLPLTDCVSVNSHPALYDRDTFMVHYMGYGPRFRGVAMRADFARIEDSADRGGAGAASPFVSTEARHGTFYVNRHDTHVGRSLAFYGEWSEPEIFLFDQIVRAGDVVIEAGANIGSHTIWLSGKVGSSGSVLAFEPARHTFYLLCANLVANGCLNVRAFQEAVGAEPGEIAFPFLDPTLPFNFGGASTRALGEANNDLVRCTSLDALGLDRLDLVKADIEGCELDLLRGAQGTIARHRPIIYLEINEAHTRDQAVGMLESIGYECWYYISPLYTPDNWRQRREDILDGHSFDMICTPKEKFQATGLLKAGVNDDVVKYPPGQIHWLVSDWRLARVTRLAEGA